MNTNRVSLTIILNLRQRNIPRQLIYQKIVGGVLLEEFYVSTFFQQILQVEIFINFIENYLTNSNLLKTFVSYTEIIRLKPEVNLKTNGLGFTNIIIYLNSLINSLVKMYLKN